MVKQEFYQCPLRGFAVGLVKWPGFSLGGASDTSLPHIDTYDCSFVACHPSTLSCYYCASEQFRRILNSGISCKMLRYFCKFLSVIFRPHSLRFVRSTLPTLLPVCAKGSTSHRVMWCAVTVRTRSFSDIKLTVCLEGELSKRWHNNGNVCILLSYRTKHDVTLGWMPSFLPLFLFQCCELSWMYCPTSWLVLSVPAALKRLSAEFKDTEVKNIRNK